MIREHFLQRNIHSYPNVLVDAPTGVAAFNISGHTLHTLLQLPTQSRSNATHRTLSPITYKLLRETFQHVQYLIIDEISMVSYNTLEHIHLRLNEIKGNHLEPNVYFGNISIIALGDFYQLRPVCGSANYSNTNVTPFHLWKEIL